MNGFMPTRKIMWNGTVRALPLREQVQAAAIAGCAAMSVTPSDCATWIDSSVKTREMLTIADDAGVKLSHLDPFVRWTDDWEPELPDGEIFPVELVAFDADEFFRLAASMEVESFTAFAGFPRGLHSTQETIDDFGRLCERADREGLRCDLEPILGWGIPDLQAAWTVVYDAERANSGIMFDMWGYVRGGRDDALLRTIPGDRITGVQLCDGTREIPIGRSLTWDALNNRRALGEGDWPVSEIVDVLRETGGLSNVGLEIFSLAYDAMSPQEIGERSRAALEEVLHSRPPADVNQSRSDRPAGTVR